MKAKVADFKKNKIKWLSVAEINSLTSVLRSDYWTTLREHFQLFSHNTLQRNVLKSCKFVGAEFRVTTNLSWILEITIKKKQVGISLNEVKKKYYEEFLQIIYTQPQS